MDKFNFKLAKRYNLTYQKKIKNFCKKTFDTIVIPYQNLMYCRASEHYYIFWTGSERIRLKKDLIQNVLEV